MPTKDEHLSKAARNEKFAEYLAEKTEYIDWGVTILFYAALHYMDAVLSVSAIDPRDHKARHTAIGVNDTLRRVYREYRLLETQSWNSRYSTIKIGPDQWHKCTQAFSILRAHIRSRLGLKN